MKTKLPPSKRPHRQKTTEADMYDTLRQGEYMSAKEILSEGQTPEKINELASNAQGYLDNLLTIIQKKTGMQPACPKDGGCTYCCYQPVGTTVPEVLAIADHLRATLSADELDAVKERCRQWAPGVSGVEDLLKIHQMCPLLEGDQGGYGGRCSVYAMRPLACRGYLSLDQSKCKRAYDDPEDMSFSIPTLGVPVGTQITKGLTQALQDRGLKSLVFLAPGLLVALENPDARQRWLDGDTLFGNI